MEPAEVALGPIESVEVEGGGAMGLIDPEDIEWLSGDQRPKQ